MHFVSAKVSNINSRFLTRTLFVIQHQNGKFTKSFLMALQVEDLDDQTKFRQMEAISYHDLVPFIIEYLKKKSVLVTSFLFFLFIFLLVIIKVRIIYADFFAGKGSIVHTALGLIGFPILVIPVHELLHIIPYWISGARRIRVGMDLKQFLFYVTAHRYVASAGQFRIVALIPFLVISVALTLLILLLPGLWKWSMSLFLFVHTTMCAGDIALLNFYYINRRKKIYTWDDADRKMAYFYEKI
jgi:hypothetical protein